jgi:hypothetical protein
MPYTVWIIAFRILGTKGKQLPYQRIRCAGITFLFKYEPGHPELLHIYVRHLTTPELAIDLFLDEKAAWNDKYRRFENYSETHGLLARREKKDS